MKSWASTWVISWPILFLLSVFLGLAVVVQIGCSQAIGATKNVYEGPCEFVGYEYRSGSNTIRAALNCGGHKVTCDQGQVVLSHIQNPCELQCTVNGNLWADCKPCTPPEKQPAVK
jgi:hypothetical protein